tara:strand:- start:282 stop:1079 length:798 start_codon:yes stop_codon:yes gene_type:complete
MFTKSFFNSLISTSITALGISFASLISSPHTAKAADCPASGNSGAMSADCYETPDVMEIKFYELGFCTTTDPLAGSNFSRTNCTKAWDSASGETADLADFNYKGLTSGLAYRIPNGTYEYAYVIFDNVWGLKGKVYFNDRTYYTNSSGGVATETADYAKFDLDVSSLAGGSGCWDYSGSTDYGPVKAVLANTSLVTADSTGTCNSATRMAGSIDLNTPLTMTSDVKTYELTWIIRKMGLWADHDSGTSPARWGGGPFVPSFTLSK